MSKDVVTSKEYGYATLMQEPKKVKILKKVEVKDTEFSISCFCDCGCACHVVG